MVERSLSMREVGGSMPSDSTGIGSFHPPFRRGGPSAFIALLGERKTEDLKVTSSILIEGILQALG